MCRLLWKRVCFMAVCICLGAAVIGHTRETYVPRALEDWKPWVVRGEEQFYCPACYDNAADVVCRWPGVLELSAGADGGGFRQIWDVMIDTWVPLPGDTASWPRQVRDGKNILPVVSRNRVPAVWLTAGAHTLHGEWHWQHMPEFISLPEETGGIVLSVPGREKQPATPDDQNRVWLENKSGNNAAEKPDAEPTLRVQVFRKIIDAVPMEMETWIRLTVSGESRRERLNGVIPGWMTAVEAAGDLPMKLVGAADLWVQVKTGEWELRLRSVQANPENRLSVPGDADWNSETWSFQAAPDVRLVRLEGGTTVDPSRTRMPDAWKSLPAYRVRKEETVRLTEIQRGSLRDDVPRLDLYRDLWIDFDGQGATVVDRMSGFVAHRRFIGLDTDGYQLGRVVLGGEDQVVHLGSDGQLGVEMERGNMYLVAVSRLDFTSKKPFTLGWSETFRKAEGVIHIPCGWKLVDLLGGVVPEGTTWWNVWSLMDAFMVLVIAAAVFRIWGAAWGALFLIGLGLIYQVPGSPRGIWLFVVVAAGLYQYAVVHGVGPDLKRMKLLKGIWGLGILMLLGISLSFSYGLIRNAAFPQLARYAATESFSLLGSGMQADMAMEVTSRVAPTGNMAMTKSFSRPVFEKMDAKSLLQTETDEEQAKSPTQTGPGIPTWRWQRVSVDFGKLVSDRPITVTLHSVWMIRLFAIVRMLLLLGMLYKSLRMAIPLIPPMVASLGKGKTAVAAAMLLMLLYAPSKTAFAAETAFPPAELLNELKLRLLEKAPCYPHCADIARLALSVDDSADKSNPFPLLFVEMDVSAATDTAIPLPDGDNTWVLTGIQVDGKKQEKYLRHRGYLWVHLEKGVHTVALNGEGLRPDALRIKFQLRPMQVIAGAFGWSVSGVSQTGEVASVIGLTRKRQSDARETETDNWSNGDAGMTDFLKVTRRLRLGLEWEVETRVSRISGHHLAHPATATIPLLDNEWIRTPGMEAKDGRVSLVLAEGVREIRYTSTLPVSDHIHLIAEKNVNRTEVWHLSADASWHVEATGVPVSYAGSSRDTRWYPRPGETVDLAVGRLAAAEGDLLTIDSLRFDYDVGESMHQVRMKGDVRTSIGQELTLTPPPASYLTAVRVNGRTLPVAQSSDRLVIPLEPGSKTFEAEWQISADSDKGTGLLPVISQIPPVTLDRTVSNIDVFMHLPDTVWLLWTRGPQLGPAVLAWGYLLLLLLAAVLLGFRSLGGMGTCSWFLLGVGMATFNAEACVVVAAWFLALEARKRLAPGSPVVYNLSQIGFIIWSLVVVVLIFEAVRNGLLGIPDMQVAGNHSSASQLHWTLDRTETGALPVPMAVYTSVWVFRLVMFLWALWLASRMVTWAKQALDALRYGGFWKPMRRGRGKKLQATHGLPGNGSDSGEPNGLAGQGNENGSTD